MPETYVIVVGLTGVLITYMLAYIPPRIFRKWWAWMISPHASLAIPDIEPFLPIRAHGLIGAPAITVNARVQAYTKLPQICMLFKERYFWWTTIVGNDLKYLSLLDTLEKPARLLKLGSTYAGEDAVMFEGGDRAKRDHARLVKSIGNMSEFLKRIHPTILEKAAVRLRKRCLESQVEFGGFSAEDESVRLAVEVSCEMLFGTKLYEDNAQKLFAAFVGFAQLGIHPWPSYPLGSFALKLANYSYISGVNKHLKDVVQARLARTEKSENLDMLDLIISGCDPNEGDIIEGSPKWQWIVDQLKGLIIASVLPIAHTMCWMFTLLGLNPEMQETIQKELDEYIIHDGSQEERPPSYLELPQLKFLEVFIKETLRLFPAMPFLDRSFKDVDSIEGKLLPRGSEFRVDLMALHRRPDFFPEPQLFDPERWTDKKKSKAQQEEAYLPFGSGARSCIGKQLALHQLRVFFATLLRNHRLKPYDAKQKLPDAFVVKGVIKSYPGFDMQILGPGDLDE